MKSNVEKVSNLERKLVVEVPASTVKSTFEKIYQNIQKGASIKGFRKGKAPLTTIRSLYSDQVKNEALQDLIQRHYAKALSEHALNPVGYPDFEFDPIDEAKDFNFSATFDVRPDVVLKKYENLEVEKEKFSFDESKVEQVLENIRTSRASQQELLEDRPAQLGDIAIVNFEGFVDGKPMENGTGQSHPLELGSKSFIDGFEEGILGMRVNESRTLSLKFPTPYHAAELAGKPVDFKVTLTGLKKKVLPELNEEFLKSLGGPGDLESLKSIIRQDIQSSEEKRIQDAFKNRLLKKLVEANHLEVPPSLLKMQKSNLIEDFRKKMLDQGMSDEEFQDYTEKWDKDFEKTAAEIVQTGFLIDAIAEKHDLSCKREDIEQKISDYSKQTGIEETKIKEFYSKPEALNRLTYSITEEKVIDFLMNTVKIHEVTADQIKEN